MSRFGLLLAFLSLLLASSVAFAADSANVSAKAQALGAMNGAAWQYQTMAAQWSGRSGGVVEWYSGPIKTQNSRGDTVTQNGNWLLLYGRGFWDCPNLDCEGVQEVWASGNNGRSWTQIQVDSEFSALTSAQTVQDSRGRQWRIQGTQQQCGDGYISDVYMSTDGGYTWLEQTRLEDETKGRFLGTAVVDSNDNIYVWGGQTCNTLMNDMWKYTQSTKAWREVKQSNAVPAARSAHGSVVGKYYDPDTKQAVDAMYIVMGYKEYNNGPGLGNIYQNDVWVTTNLGSPNAQWLRLTANAAFLARGDSQLEITSTGVMLVIGGVSTPNGPNNRVLNDVWASLDGGYTWGLCSDNARWDDRQFQYTAIDSDGYLYVMGGRAQEDGGGSYQAHDVWKSTRSFSDVQSTADMCGLIVPPCGTGLRCLPRDNGFVQGVWGVSCDACSWNPNSTASSGTSTSMIMTYLFIAFLLLSIALAALLGYLIYRMRQTGASSPIPLPASAQRWWNDKQTGGLSDSLNKGNTSSEGDSMYNPLTIRDQM